VQNEATPTVPPEEQTEKWKALKPRIKAVNVSKYEQRGQESIWEAEGEVGDWAGKRVRCAQKMTRRGGAGKGSKGCRGADHCQTCTNDRTGAVALRVALESAVSLGRGDDRQARENGQPFDM
jgi:hypothetical protein